MTIHLHSEPSQRKGKIVRYKILKSSSDGISGGDSCYETVDEVLREVTYHRGWDSKEQLHAAIRKWSNVAEPGSVFSTQVTAIVAVGVGSGMHADDACTECGNEGMDYSVLEVVESGNIEQEVKCPACNRRWKDVFVLVDRRRLCP